MFCVEETTPKMGMVREINSGGEGERQQSGRRTFGTVALRPTPPNSSRSTCSNHRLRFEHNPRFGNWKITCIDFPKVIFLTTLIYFRFTACSVNLSSRNYLGFRAMSVSLGVRDLGLHDGVHPDFYTGWCSLFGLQDGVHTWIWVVFCHVQGRDDCWHLMLPVIDLDRSKTSK